MSRLYGTSIILFGLLITSCGPQTSFRDNVGNQNSADIQAKMAELQEVAGTYTGKMMMTASGLPFDVVITINPLEQNDEEATPPNPTGRVQQPWLVGEIRFPAIDAHRDLNDFSQDPEFPELKAPLGQFNAGIVTRGDFNPKLNNLLVLPYSDAKKTATFGELTGHVIDDRYSGTWVSMLSTVGTFKNLIRTPPGVSP